MKTYILVSTTPLDELHQNFIPAYEQMLEYAKVTGLFIAVAGVMIAVVKSSRN